MTLETVEADRREAILQTGAWVTLAMSVAVSVHLLLTPEGPHRGVLLALAAAAAADAAVVSRARGRLAGMRSFGTVLTGWNGAHIAVATAMCVLDGGAQSPFVAIFFLSVAFAAVALPRRGVFVVAALDVIAIVAVVLASGGGASDWADAVLWGSGLAVTAAVCAVIADDRARRTRALDEAKEEMLRRLARVVEFRDDDTAGHVERMSAYAELLARRLGLDHIAGNVRLASTMHDIGKVAVPDAILLKPGPLTAEEREVMERHAQLGHEMLTGSGSGVLDLAATIALTHHERYDGSGYPRGLAGAAIPLVGRIVAVADVFDALTSDRVYKDALPMPAAVDIIRGEAGRHFDPDVVEAFLEILDDVDRVRQSHRDAPAGRRRGAVTLRV
jgi:hypothetical protein